MPTILQMSLMYAFRFATLEITNPAPESRDSSERRPRKPPQRMKEEVEKRFCDVIESSK
jgi:hypothetical protein